MTDLKVYGGEPNQWTKFGKFMACFGFLLGSRACVHNVGFLQLMEQSTDGAWGCIWGALRRFWAHLEHNFFLIRQPLARHCEGQWVTWWARSAIVWFPKPHHKDMIKVSQYRDWFRKRGVTWFCSRLAWYPKYPTSFKWILVITWGGIQWPDPYRMREHFFSTAESA